MKTYPVYADKHHLKDFKSAISKKLEDELISLNVQVLYDKLGLDVSVFKNSTPFFVFTVSAEWEITREFFPGCDQTKLTESKWLDAVRASIILLKEGVETTNDTEPPYIIQENEDYWVY